MTNDENAGQTNKETRKPMKNDRMLAPTNDQVLHDALSLEFPDWSGMKPNRSKMTFEEAVHWNNEMLSLFPTKKMPAKLERERRCDTEFVL